MSSRAGTGWIDLLVANKKLEASLSSAKRTVEQKLAGISNKMAETGRKMTRNVTLPILAAGGAAINEAVKVEGGLREVMTLFGDLGDEGGAVFDELQTGVTGLSNELGIAQETLTAGLYQAISAGVPRENAFEFLRVASKAAIAGVTDTETAVDGITSIINAFGLEASDAQAVADSMFTAVKGGKTDFESLSAAVFNVAPAAAAAGISFGEVNAAIAALTAGGTPTSVAMTQLRGVISELGKAGSQVSGDFERLSGKTFRQFIAEGGNLQEALAVLAESAGPALTSTLEDLNSETSDLAAVFRDKAGKSFQQFLEDGGTLAEALDLVKDHTGPVAESMADMFGSVEAGAAVLTLGQTASEKFTAELANQADAAGAVEGAYDQMEQSRSRKLERAKVSFQNLAITIGTMLLPVVDRLSEWVQKLAGWFERQDEGTKKLMVTIAGLAAAIGPLLIVGAKLINTARLIGGAFVLMDKETGRFVAGPVTRVVRGFASMAAAAVRAGAKMIATLARMAAQAAVATAQFVAQVAVQVAQWVLLGVQSLIHAAKVAAAWLIAMGPLGLVVAAVIAAVALIVANWDTIKNAVSKALEFVKNFISRNWPIILALLTGPIGIAVLAIIRNWDRIKSAASTAVQWIKDRFQSVVDFFAGLPTKISNAASGMWNGIKNSFRGVLNWVIDKWNNFRFGFSWDSKKIAGVTVFPGGSAYLNTPNIPRIHTGGVITRSTAPFPGLRSDEVPAVLQAGETVFTSDQMAELGRVISGASGGQRSGMNFYGPVSFGSERSVDDLDWWARTKRSGV